MTIDDSFGAAPVRRIAPAEPALSREAFEAALRDVEHGLKATLDHFTRRDQQERALTIGVAI
ncbi:MAG TPA: hypothetical protein VF446_06290 [Trinickia sp.]